MYFTKVNADTVLFETKRCFGFASVARNYIGRNYRGHLVEALSRRWEGVTAPEIVEAMSVTEALSWINRKGWSNVIVELDCCVVVQVIRSVVTMQSSFGLVISDGKSLLSQLRSIQLSLI